VENNLPSVRWATQREYEPEGVVAECTATPIHPKDRAQEFFSKRSDSDLTTA
jgi:hypothetical protein